MPYCRDCGREVDVELLCRACTDALLARALAKAPSRHGPPGLVDVDVQDAIDRFEGRRRRLTGVA